MITTSGGVPAALGIVGFAQLNGNTKLFFVGFAQILTPRFPKPLVPIILLTRLSLKSLDNRGAIGYYLVMVCFSANR